MPKRPETPDGKRRSQDHTKRCNGALAEKLEIRRMAIREFGGRRVLETHAGHGVMSEAYAGLPSLRVDTDKTCIGCVHIDSRHLLRSSTLDLNAFDVFDIDAFNSPWEHVWIISQRRRSSRVLLFITDGASSFNERFRRTAETQLSKQMIDAMGMKPSGVLRFGRQKSQRMSTLIVAMCLPVWFAPLRIARAWSATNPSGQIDYHAIILEPPS